MLSIQMALTDRKVIRLDYQSPNSPETTSRLVEPFAFINRVGESWYLIGWCQLRKDYRLFRFDRIQQLSVTEATFAPHKMTLEEYLLRYRHKQQPLT
ncbi:helix-turn-helix transcriptional regulator [Spirosoma flavum]|uniref:Helix-turn-helix transcriptional regulator n=1 Tax=Spirosoma flavum TaxID=2048557 RepID=A0ABW6AL23_9BACT